MPLRLREESLFSRSDFHRLDVVSLAEHANLPAFDVNSRNGHIPPSSHGFAFPVCGVIGKFDIDIRNNDDPAFTEGRKFCINGTE